MSASTSSHDDGEEVLLHLIVEISVQSAPRINVYENIPFAGGDGDYSILSVLFGVHSIGEGIFIFQVIVIQRPLRLFAKRV